MIIRDYVDDNGVRWLVKQSRYGPVSIDMGKGERT